MSKIDALSIPGIVAVPENWNDSHNYFVGSIDAWGDIRIFGSFVIRGHAFGYAEVMAAEGTPMQVFCRIGGEAITEGLLPIS